MWTQPAPVVSTAFITLLLIWPFRLRYLLNILPWTKCLLLGCWWFSLYDHFLCYCFLCLLSYGLLLSRRLSASCPCCHLKWPLFFFSPPAPHLLYVRFPYPLHLFSFLASLSISVSIFYCIVLWGASEGKMVVLALAIGVAEQDDFANIPDLQETAQAAPPANQEPPPEKRYQIMYGSVCCTWENGVQMTGREGHDIEEKQKIISESRQRRVVLFCSVFGESLHSSALCHKPAPEIAPEPDTLLQK